MLTKTFFGERIEMYRGFIENVMNEEIVPRLVSMGYIKPGLEFKYANRVEMSNKDKISLYSFITDKYEVSADEIEKEFGIVVGKQFNAISEMASNSGSINGSSMIDALCPMKNITKDMGIGVVNEKNSSNVENFLMEGE